MRRMLKRWFLPCTENNYEPHLLRALPVAFLLVTITAFFGAAQLLERNLVSLDSSLAAVVSSVLVDLTNFDRAQEGLHGLAVNTVLQHAAQLKANDMAAKGYFAHNSPNGQTPWFWFQEAGYTFAYAGENLAVFFGDSEDVARAWMNSPSHRANILSSNFTEIGIATAEGYYQGQRTIFVVQMFGTPAVVRQPVATLATEPGQDEIVPEGEVSGESIQIIGEDDVEETETIYQDDMFIAVKGNLQAAPSETFSQTHSTFLERMLASPHTALSYIYALIAGVVAATLIFLIFLEMHVQKPRSILYGVLLLIVISGLLYLSYSDVVVASTASAFHLTS